MTPNEVYTLANPTVVTIAATVKNALEVGQTNGTFTVSRTGSTGIPMNVYYAVSGPATNGTDYTTLPGYVTIPAGQPSATITVVPVDDNLIEGDENVVLTLDNAANNYTVGSPAGDTVIHHNEPIHWQHVHTDGQRRPAEHGQSVGGVHHQQHALRGVRPVRRGHYPSAANASPKCAMRS